MNKYAQSGIFTIMSLWLAGCGNLMAINKQFEPDKGESISIDAKQRTVYSIKKTYKDAHGNPTYDWRAICAEPSPDALTAISASGGFSAEIVGKAVSTALSGQESSASIGLRTQTIQILRDAMYRLCEGYASGALDDIAFARLQRRYQNIMLGLLAIEQLTGAVVAKQVVIASTAEASMALSMAEIQKEVNAALQAKREVDKNASDAQDIADAKNAESLVAQKDYDALKKKNDDKEGADEVKKFKADKLDPAKKAMQSATAQLTAVKKEQVDAESNVIELQKIRANLGKISTRAQGVGAFDGGSIATTINPQTAATISTTVHSIVTDIVNKNYTRETCLDAMLSRDFKVLDRVAYKMALRFCAAYLEADLIRETSMVESGTGASKNITNDATKNIRALDAAINEIDVSPTPPSPTAPSAASPTPP